MEKKSKPSYALNQNAMVPMIVKKVSNIKLEALLAVGLSCSTYVMDNLNKEAASNDALFRIAKIVHNYFIKGNRYNTKDAKQINKLLSETFNPIIMTGHNPGALLIVILSYLILDEKYSSCLALTSPHNVHEIKRLSNSLEYHYYKHYIHSSNILQCLLGNMTTEEMLYKLNNPEVKTYETKLKLSIILEEEYFTIKMVNKSLIKMFSLENELGIDFDIYKGTKIEEITFSNDLLREFKEFISLNNKQDPINKELIYLKENLGV